MGRGQHVFFGHDDGIGWDDWSCSDVVRGDRGVGSRRGGRVQAVQTVRDALTGHGERGLEKDASLVERRERGKR